MTTSPFSAYCSCNFLNNGKCSRHGGQLLAQKSTTTTLPRCLRISCLSPSYLTDVMTICFFSCVWPPAAQRHARTADAAMIRIVFMNESLRRMTQHSVILPQRAANRQEIL